MEMFKDRMIELYWGMAIVKNESLLYENPVEQSMGFFI
jgi:hypothetical protein